MLADLFGDALLPGLAYKPAVLSRDEQSDVVQQLEAMDLAPFRFQGWLGKRKTHTFGWRYDFEDASFAPAEPLPDWLSPLRKHAAEVAGVEPEAFVHALIARYDPGAGIGWHRDRPVFDQVVGFSFGSPAVLRFRRRKSEGFDRMNLEVEPGSAYLLTGEVRHEWEHSIAPGDALRFSVTLRTLSDLGRRKAAV